MSSKSLRGISLDKQIGRLGNGKFYVVRDAFMLISPYQVPLQQPSILCLAMLCHCPTNTLRLFIRSVAQVDLPITAKYVPRRPFQSSSIRDSRLAFRSPQQFSRRSFSSAGRSCGRQASAEQVVGSHIEDVEASEKGPVATSQNEDESAFAEFSLDSIDEILAESRSENPPEDGLVDAVVVEDGTPASFVASSFSKQREIREKKGKERDIVWRPLNNERQPLQTLVVKQPRATMEDRQDSWIRPDTRDTEQHATFPRLPRVRRESIDTTPLKSRLAKLAAVKLEPTQSYGGREWVPREREQWQIDKDSRIKKYPEGWKPQKRLSPDAISGIRALHAQLPEEYHTRKLAETFQVSPEAISRILRTHWSPSSEEEEDRTRRWLKRGESVWSRYAEAGVKPPKKWREAGIGNGKPEWMINKPTTKKKEPGPTPALVTQPRRSGGLYQLGGKRKSSGSDDGGFI